MAVKRAIPIVPRGRHSYEGDHLGLLWQELAETVARAQRLVNERAQAVIQPRQRGCRATIPGR